MKNLSYHPIALALISVLAIPAAVQATATRIGSEAGVFQEGIRVQYVNEPGAEDVDDDTGEPMGEFGCSLDASDITGQLSTYSVQPTFITVSYEDPVDVWAIADCMPEITSYVDQNIPGTKVLIDLTALFNGEQGGGSGGYNTLHPFLDERTDAWYARATSEPPFFAANEILGFVVHIETHGNAWSNYEMNVSIRDGVEEWTSGPGWNIVDTVAGFPLWPDFFPRYNGQLPWRLDVAVIYHYQTYAPLQENHPLNYIHPNSSGGFFETIQTFYDHTFDANGRKLVDVALNIRGFFFDMDTRTKADGVPTGPDDPWTLASPRWSQLGWCRWASQQTYFDIVWTTTWTWRSYPEDPENIRGLNYLSQETVGSPDMDDQTQELFELARGLTTSCSI